MLIAWLAAPLNENDVGLGGGGGAETTGSATGLGSSILLEVTE